MEKELKTKMDELLIQLIEDATATKEFIIDQAPDVINQLLAWNFATSLAWFMIFILMVLAPIWFLWKRRGWIKEYISGSDPDDIALACFSLFFPGLAYVALTSFTFSIDWLKIWVAPKIWLIEYAANLAT